MAKPTHKRIFIGITPPEKIIKSLSRAVYLYKKWTWAEHVKWVKPANLHLTLKFLGNINIKSIEPLAAVVQESVSTISPFNSYITGLRIFPKPSRPSVLSAGIKGHHILPDLAAKIEAALEDEGFPKEKRAFKGHITIGRCNKHFPWAQKISNIIEPGSFHVHEIIIFSSILKPHGPEYFVESRISL